MSGAAGAGKRGEGARTEEREAIGPKKGDPEGGGTDGSRPLVVAFLCNWCSYAGADLAGTSRLKYPPSVRVIRVMCTGRLNPLFVIQAFRRGADGVLVAGCHPGECHYIEGNLHTRRRFALMQPLLTYMGIEPERLQVHWISASEGPRFAEVVVRMTDELRALGPQTQLSEVKR